MNNIERLKRLTPELICDVYNELGIVNQVLHTKHTNINPLDKNSIICGIAYTVSYDDKSKTGLYQNNREFLDEVGVNNVIIIDAKCNNDSSVWGYLLSLYAQQHNIRGTITNGSTRDVNDIMNANYKVFCNGFPCERSNTGYNITSINQAITWNQCIINNGDYILASLSGIAIISPLIIDDVLNAAEKKQQKELLITELIDCGHTLKEITQMTKY